MVESVAGNSLGRMDRIRNTYNFASELISALRTHTAFSNTTTIANAYQYDHMGRSLAVKEKINAQDDIWLNRMEYNGIGQLKQKYLHSTDGSFFLQNTKYAYNERGWLKSYVSNEFSFKLGYDTLSTPQYNGNIRTQLWGKPASYS